MRVMSALQRFVAMHGVVRAVFITPLATTAAISGVCFGLPPSKSALPGQPPRLFRSTSFTVLNAVTAGHICCAAGIYHHGNRYHAKPGAGHPAGRCVRPHGHQNQCGMHATVIHGAPDSRVLLLARVRSMCSSCAPGRQLKFQILMVPAQSSSFGCCGTASRSCGLCEPSGRKLAWTTGKLVSQTSSAHM